ncbi:MAG TPA: hypothetical protein DCM08_10420 [Microscillaceae bacterium]|jgi:hypothetical protein|nr:hypothetical protein [Microscillaceae bacterium]
MDNDPELAQRGKYLGTITQDFVKVSRFLFEASYQVRARHISDFPLFILSKQAVPGLQSLLTPAQHKVDWHYMLSFVEDFYQRGWLKEVESFKQAYKNPDEFCCLCVLDEGFTNFVFIPYPEDDEALTDYNGE